VPLKSNKLKNLLKNSFVGILGKSMTKIAGSGSGSISQRHGSADTDPDPNPPQNVMDPQHCSGADAATSTFPYSYFCSVHRILPRSKIGNVYHLRINLNSNNTVLYGT
jgi:hypothetical protein